MIMNIDDHHEVIWWKVPFLCVWTIFRSITTFWVAPQLKWMDFELISSTYSVIHTNYPTGKWTYGSYTYTQSIYTEISDYRLVVQVLQVYTYMQWIVVQLWGASRNQLSQRVWMNSEATIPPVHCTRPYQLNNVHARENESRIVIWYIPIRYVHERYSYICSWELYYFFVIF